jgi:hypothetical protein
MGVKTQQITNADGSHRGWMVQCPACGYPHIFDARWTFDGNHEAPTFSPSMKVNTNHGEPPVDDVCHSFLRGGVWEFLGDCTHAMKGQKVPAPDWQKTA